MSKRKVVSGSDKEPKKKLKGDSNSAANKRESKLSFDSPEASLRSLIYPTTLEDFMAKYWEKEPLFIHRSDQNYFKGFPSYAKLEEIIKSESLYWHRDLSFTTDRDDEQESLVKPDNEVTLKDVQQCLKEKRTILFDTPHRFHTELYLFLQLLEEHFGCPMSCFFEMRKGIDIESKPGYFGREEFIIQLDGKKRWCFFEPIQKLAVCDDEDLPLDKVGGVTHEFLMEPGDVLYIPRGAVHQAHGVPGEISGHLFVDFYEGYNVGTFLKNILGKAVDQAIEQDVAFRESPSVNLVHSMGFGKKVEHDNVNNSNGTSNGTRTTCVPSVPKQVVDKWNTFVESLKKLLPLLGQHLDPHWGADMFYGKNFITKRLPPKKKEEEEMEDEFPPTDESFVALKYPEYMRIMLNDPHDPYASESESDEDDNSMEEDLVEDEKEEAVEEKTKTSAHNKRKSSENSAEAGKHKTKSKEHIENLGDDVMSDDTRGRKGCCIAVYHSLNNKVEPEKTGVEEEDLDDDEDKEVHDKLTFPLHYRDALLILYRTSGPVAVRDLPLTAEERVELVEMLWCEGLLKEVVGQAA